MADIGTGATLGFASATESYAIRNISIGDVSRAAVDSSHLGTTTARTFIAGDLYDPGTIEVEYLYDPATASTNKPILTDAAQTITITWQKTATTATTGGKFAASGFITSFGQSTPLEDIQVANMTFKCSGAITFTDQT